MMESKTPALSEKLYQNSTRFLKMYKYHYRWSWSVISQPDWGSWKQRPSWTSRTLNSLGRSLLSHGCLCTPGSAMSLIVPVQYVPKRSSKLQTFKDVNVHSRVQSCKLVYMFGVYCHVRASSTSGCAFVYFTVQYCIEYSSTVSLFPARFARGRLHWTPCCATRGAY